MRGDLLGPCRKCGLTLIETSVMGWPGHASRPASAHYPQLSSAVVPPPPPGTTAEDGSPDVIGIPGVARRVRRSVARVTGG